MMKQILVLAYFAASVSAQIAVDPCEKVSCKPIECVPPFKFVTKENTGTCCPLCWAEDIKVPEDRSWAKGLEGGVPMNPNADPILCRDVVCLKPDCEEFDQTFDGRCCTKCKSSLTSGGSADAAKTMREDYAPGTRSSHADVMKHGGPFEG